MRTRNFLLCVILTGFSLKAFAQKTGALNLLTNLPVKIANQKLVPEPINNGLGVAYQTIISTKVGAVYEISISR